MIVWECRIYLNNLSHGTRLKVQHRAMYRGLTTVGGYENVKSMITEQEARILIENNDCEQLTLRFMPLMTKLARVMSETHSADFDLLRAEAHYQLFLFCLRLCNLDSSKRLVIAEDKTVKQKMMASIRYRLNDLIIDHLRSGVPDHFDRALTNQRRDLYLLTDDIGYTFLDLKEHLFKLTEGNPKEETFVNSLLEGMTYEQAGKAIGISRMSAWRLRNELYERFVELYSN